MSPKSILKKPSATSTPVEEQPAPRPPGPASAPADSSRNYQLALQHANLIQARKDIEAFILSAIEELIYFPDSPTADPAKPSTTDLARLRVLLQAFQTSDYDELFEERNLVEKCGYVLCPRKRRTEPHRGPLRFAHGTDGKGMRIISAKQAEMWCSSDCARRALFIKVQLGETPAWERLGGHTRPIEVLDEGGQEELEHKMQTLKVAGDAPGEELETAMGQLAIERGEKASSIAGAQKKDRVLLADLVENETSGAAAPAPSVTAGSNSGIEGYTPRSLDDLVASDG